MKKILEKYSKNGITLGSVESMTGGLFAAEFTAIPGSSKVFKGSIVSYNVDVKEDVVGVNPKTIKTYSVVSKEVAVEMAEKGRKLLGVDVCVSVTGNAGPTAEPGDEEVGNFYVAVASNGETVVKKFHVSGKRNRVRNGAILAMRDMLYLLKI